MKKIRPMLASSVKDEKLELLWKKLDWFCEEKVDGSRYVLQFDFEGKPCLTSRRISVKTNKPVEKTDNLRGYVCLAIPGLADTVLDGEIVGGESFSETVKLMGSSPDKAQALLKDGYKVRYIVYDILEYKGEDLRDTELYVRKKVLEKVVRQMNNPYIELVREFDNKKESYEEVVAEGGEGIILKYARSVYSEALRSKEWVKVKKTITEEGVIMDMAEGSGKYEGNLGALKVGQFFGDELKEVASISGMSDAERRDFWDNKKAYLAEATTVEFSAQEKTKARYRHPQFVRLRPDKSPIECRF